MKKTKLQALKISRLKKNEENESELSIDRRENAVYR